MNKSILLLAVLAFVSFKNQAQTVTDIDGNIYNTVTIGTQVWMKENLKVTHFRNGTLIPNITTGTAWSTLTKGARCYYNNDSVLYAPVYGALYNFFAVDDIANICPTGWHVATYDEWKDLRTFLGGTGEAGGKLKEVGTAHWKSPNSDATNSSGFTALPGNYRYFGGAFYGIGVTGFWWSSTESSSSRADYFDLHYNDGAMNTFDAEKRSGYSVRCIKDNFTQIKDNKVQEEIKVYPNPAFDQIFVTISKNYSKMQVLNMIGNCVLQSDLNLGANAINISSLTKGIYMLRLTGAKGTYQQKLIKN